MSIDSYKRVSLFSKQRKFTNV